MNIVEPMISENPDIKIAVIDEDEPGGICLTRGCIPSKLLLYPAELIREIENASKFDIDVEIKNTGFNVVMDRMRTHISENIDIIREGLYNDGDIDSYQKIFCLFSIP